MDGEAANVAETPGHPVRIGACRGRRPSQGSLDGQMLFATKLDEVEELSQELLGTSEPVTKGAPYGQVISEGLEGVRDPRCARDRLDLRYRKAVA
jgi:hypothetical protein